MRSFPVLLAAALLLCPVPSLARRSSTQLPVGLRPASPPHGDTLRRGDAPPGVLSASAAAETTILFQTGFDVGITCATADWTVVDGTVQSGTFFHVDDFAGLAPPYAPLAGTNSLWCGAHPDASGPLCGYATLPGYGNNWNQAFCTKDCIPVSGDGILDVSFLARFDSEPDYDATYLQYNLDCGGNANTWIDLDGGLGVWDGDFSTTVNGAYAVGSTGPVKVRIAFFSDETWSDQDGLWDTSGAVVVDDLVAEGIPLEDFEGETVGATAATDWESCNVPGYGIALALFPGAALVQEDPCQRDMSCVWAAIAGSTATYACGGFPAQTAVPFKNARDQYLMNEIISPDIPLIGIGNQINVEFSVYRDLPLDNLIFYNWRVRTVYPPGTCPPRWEERELVYFGDQKDWRRHVEPAGDLIDQTNGIGLTVALRVLDMCGFWCGYYGSGACHSHAPLFDNVRVYRVNTLGPQWFIRDIDQFQDTFASDGTTTGTARADMAIDVSPDFHYNSIIPGDSAVVRVADPGAGLAADGGRAAVYGYFAVWPQGQAGKSGAGIQAPEMRSGSPRYPVIGTWNDAGGVTWTCVQMDSCITSGFAQPDRYCVDLNDNLFTPGDTISFFYAARNTNDLETYAFGSSLGATGFDREVAAANASEFTILPASTSGDRALYVDGMDGRGAEVYWEAGLTYSGFCCGSHDLDRFDVRGPSSGVNNRLAGRVVDVQNQLNASYRVILWDCGDLLVGLGDGSGTPLKTNDYALINEFLANLASPGGVYICGDDVGEALMEYQSVDALAFRATYLPFNLTSRNARPGYGISPAGLPAAFPFDDTFVIYGGCPVNNDFDVLAPVSPAENKITYGPGDATSVNGALIGNAVGNARVLFGGFSYIYIRDDDTDGETDRVTFLKDVLVFLGMTPDVVDPVAPTGLNSLAQNYPNPFNPQTTIAFSLKQPGTVRLVIYDVSGARVRTLADGAFTEGAHTRVWDGRNDAGSPVSSGVYFYKLVAGDFTQTRKMVLLK